MFPFQTDKQSQTTRAPSLFSLRSSLVRYMYDNRVKRRTVASSSDKIDGAMDDLRARARQEAEAGRRAKEDPPIFRTLSSSMSSVAKDVATQIASQRCGRSLAPG